jgi:hypothetical protein
MTISKTIIKPVQIAQFHGYRPGGTAIKEGMTGP